MLHGWILDFWKCHFFLSRPPFSKVRKTNGFEQSRFPDGAGAFSGRTLESRSRPLPTHPGMKYFHRGDLAVDLGPCPGQVPTSREGGGTQRSKCIERRTSGSEHLLFKPSYACRGNPTLCFCVGTRNCPHPHRCNLLDVG